MEGTFSSLMLCDAETVALRPLLTGIQQADTKAQRNAFDWQQGGAGREDSNGQQSDYGTMPLWHSEISHIGRVREFFLVPLLPLPQG